VQWVAKSVYDISRDQRVDMLERLVEIDGLSIENVSNMGSVLALYRTHGLKLIDSMISAYALAEEIPVVSYDTDFDTLGCKRLEPGEVVSSS
jgi:predicted nucleic acid-binding protein